MNSLLPLLNQNLPTTASTASTASKADSLKIDGAQDPSRSEGELRDVFGQFVGETFFNQLIKSMRTSVGKPTYFHGGRAEEVFQGQLDQMLSEQIADSSSERIAQPMFELYQLQRQR